MRRLFIASLLLVGACSTSPTSTPLLPTPASQGISGNVTLSQDEPVQMIGGNCTGTGGYDDLAVGTPVVIRDGDGSVLGTGRLTGTDTNAARSCTWRFSVPVPRDAPFYEVEVSHRGGGTYSRDELAAMDWELALSIGP